MKKLSIILSLILIGTTVSLQAASVTVQSASGPAPVSVPIAYDFTDVTAGAGAFEVSVTYAPSQVTFIGGTPNATINGLGNFTIVENTPGTIELVFSIPTAAIPSTGYLADLEFNPAPGSDLDTAYPISGSIDELTEYGTSSQVTVTLSFNDGTVTFTAYPTPIRNWAIYITIGLIVVFGAFMVRRMV